MHNLSIVLFQFYCAYSTAFNFQDVVKQCSIDRCTLLALLYTANVWLQAQTKYKTERLHTTTPYKHKFIISLYTSFFT